MTCVFNSLIKELKLIPEYKDNLSLRNPDTFIQYIKSNNREVTDIIINNNKISKKMKEENFEWIKNIQNIRNGYFCSTCDPLFILVSKLYNVNIIHKYNGIAIEYKNTINNNRVLNLSSNSSHMTSTSMNNIKVKNNDRDTMNRRRRSKR